MKKTLIALAVLAASGASFAQNAVTLSGNLGAGVTSSSFKDGTSTKVLGQTDGSVTFAANEDLGGGLSVAISQTLAFGGAQGGSATNDGGSIEIKGAFGAAKFGMACAGAALGEAVVGGSYHFAHALGTTGGDCREYKYGLYTLPSFVAGLTTAVRIQNTAAGNALSLDGFSAAENGAQLRLNYNVGDLTTGYYVRSNSGEIHAAYNLGVASVKFGADTKVSSGDKRQEFGLSVPAGAFTFALGYGKKGTIKGTELGGTYALSKRTAVVGTYGTFTPNSSQAAGTAQETAARLKLVHSF